MLNEPLAGAPRITAPPQLGIEQIEQRAADLADLQVPERRLGNPPDVNLVRLPGRQVPVGHLGVPVHELGSGSVRLRLLREDYARRAGAAATYREAAGITDPGQATAPEPHHGNPELDHLRQATIRALEIRDETEITRGMTKGELEARILDGDRALVSAHGFPQFTRYSAACDLATTELADLIKARIG